MHFVTSHSCHNDSQRQVEQANVASVTVGTIKAGTGQGPSPKRRTDPRRSSQILVARVLPAQ